MTTYPVVFTPEARDQLAGIYRLIAVSSAITSVAARYTEAIVAHCEQLAEFPLRGVRREDIRPGLRITNYRKRTVSADSVDDECVAIIGVFYGGQDYEAALGTETGE